MTTNGETAMTRITDQGRALLAQELLWTFRTKMEEVTEHLSAFLDAPAAHDAPMLTDIRSEFLGVQAIAEVLDATRVAGAWNTDDDAFRRAQNFADLAGYDGLAREEIERRYEKVRVAAQRSVSGAAQDMSWSFVDPSFSDLTSYGPPALDGLTDSERYAAVFAILSDARELISGLTENVDKVMNSNEDNFLTPAADAAGYMRSLHNLQATLDALAGSKPRRVTVTTPRIIGTEDLAATTGTTSHTINASALSADADATLAGDALSTAATAGVRAEGATERADRSEPTLNLFVLGAEDLIPYLHGAAMCRLVSRAEALSNSSSAFVVVELDLLDGDDADPDVEGKAHREYAALLDAQHNLQQVVAASTSTRPTLAASLVLDLAQYVAADIMSTLSNDTFTGDDVERVLDRAKLASRLLVLTAAARRHLPADEPGDAGDAPDPSRSEAHLSRMKDRPRYDVVIVVPDAADLDDVTPEDIDRADAIIAGDAVVKDRHDHLSEPVGKRTIETLLHHADAAITPKGVGATA